jgi:hypothetical protein
MATATKKISKSRFKSNAFDFCHEVEKSGQ